MHTMPVTTIPPGGVADAALVVDSDASHPLAGALQPMTSPGAPS